MTKVAILPERGANGVLKYRAVAAGKESEGKTAGEALDTLTGQLSPTETGTLIILQQFRPDEFFSAEQQRRLAELMDCWRQLRDRGEQLPSGQQAELDELIEAELRASTERSVAMLKELAQ